MKRFDVVTFGSGVVDVFLPTGQKGKKIEFDIGSKILIDDLKFDVGGGATNSAVAFSRLGLKTGCICNVGNDNNGKDVLDCLKREGVKFLGGIVDGRTGCSVILDSGGGDRVVLTFKGPGNFIRGVCDFETKWLYFSSVLGESLGTQIRLARRMKNRGTKLAFNPSEYLIGELGVLSLLRMSDVVVLNREEFELVEKKYGKSLLEICLGVVVVTDKDKKIICFADGKKYFLNPHRMKVVERTGAGDAFASGFVAGVIANKSISESLRLGLKESESIIKYFGAKNNLLRMKLR